MIKNVIGILIMKTVWFEFYCYIQFYYKKLNVMLYVDQM